MIYRVRTVNVFSEQEEAIRSLLVRGAAYAGGTFPGIQGEILENVAGARSQYHMVTRCDSLAALEQYEAIREDDAGWRAWIEAAKALQGVADAVDHL